MSIMPRYGDTKPDLSGALSRLGRSAEIAAAGVKAIADNLILEYNIHHGWADQVTGGKYKEQMDPPNII